MRIIACFFVIFNHLPGYSLYGITDSPLKSWVYMIPTMITRINVPIFFMISGTLLLTDKQESYKKIIQKRFMRIIYALALFTLILYLVSIGQHQVKWSFSQYLWYLFAEPIDIGGRAYWYLYCYLGFLLLLPILRRITKGMTKADFILLLSVHFFFSSLIPIVNIILTSHGIDNIVISPHFSEALDLALDKVMFYPLIGYYIDHSIDLKNTKPKQIILLCLFGIAGIVVSNICTYYEGTHGDMIFTQNYVSLFDYISTICVFILIKYICLKHNGYIAHPHFVKTVTLIGSLTYGIYLIDPVLKKLVYIPFETILEPFMITFFVSILWCLTSMIIGGLITFELNKVSIFKKIF
ncbi:acyltransferase [Erysipelotrichaceae bacterium 66-17]